MAEQITESNFEEEVIKSEMPVLVDFFAVWCGPCKALSPVIDELAEEYKGKIKIVKVDVDENSNLASRFSVMSIPTLVFFKEGKAVDQAVGGMTKDELKGRLDGLI